MNERDLNRVLQSSYVGGGNRIIFILVERIFSQEVLCEEKEQKKAGAPEKEEKREMKNWDLKIQFEYETADLDENGFKLSM